MDIGEVLAEKGLEQRTLDCPCTFEHRNDIARHITNWKALAPFIGLERTDEEDIEEDNTTVKTRRIALLRKWSEKRGKGATYLHLMKGFAQISRRDLIEMLCDIFSASQGARATASPGARATASPGAGTCKSAKNVPHLGMLMFYAYVQ